MEPAGPRVAITGASSGIGAAAALAFAARGCALSLAARRSAELEEVATRARRAGAPRVDVHVVDVTRDADVQTWARELRRNGSGLDLLVANAGVGHYGPFLDAHPEHMERMLQTNVLGVWRVVHAVAPLLEQARGHVIVVGSIAGKVSLPYLSTYSAGKAALLAWTRGVRPEFQQRGITLTLLAPGFTRTPFARSALRSGEARRPDGHDGRGRGASADSVAQAMVRAWKAKPREMNLTLQGRVGVAAAAVAPHFVAARMERGMRPQRSRDMRV